MGQRQSWLTQGALGTCPAFIGTTAKFPEGHQELCSGDRDSLSLYSLTVGPIPFGSHKEVGLWSWPEWPRAPPAYSTPSSPHLRAAWGWEGWFPSNSEAGE